MYKDADATFGVHGMNITIEEMVPLTPRPLYKTGRMVYKELSENDSGWCKSTVSFDDAPLGILYKDVDDMWSASQDVMDRVRHEINPHEMKEWVQIQIEYAIQKRLERKAYGWGRQPAGSA